jgi:mannose-1-phosphate guanylyltransferase
MDHVALAAQAVAHDPSRIVLLAMEAQYPEVEYGYVVPREDHGRLNLWGIRNIAKFIEKPDPKTDGAASSRCRRSAEYHDHGLQSSYFVGDPAQALSCDA